MRLFNNIDFKINYKRIWVDKFLLDKLNKYSLGPRNIFKHVLVITKKYPL